MSNIKLGIYEFLGLMIPGILAVFEVWVTIQPWHEFADSVNHLGTGSLTALLIAGLALGHLIQELGDAGLKGLKGPRFFRQARDNFWESAEAEAVKGTIWAESRLAMNSVDAAFDYCMTRIEGLFQKRDGFVATSDLARSFLVLSILGIAPGLRITLESAHSILGRLLVGGVCFAVLLLTSYLSWRRMLRFRELSETPVFRVFLAKFGSERMSSGNEPAEPAASVD